MLSFNWTTLYILSWNKKKQKINFISHEYKSFYERSFELHSKLFSRFILNFVIMTDKNWTIGTFTIAMQCKIQTRNCSIKTVIFFHIRWTEQGKWIDCDLIYRAILVGPCYAERKTILKDGSLAESWVGA